MRLVHKLPRAKREAEKKRLVHQLPEKKSGLSIVGPVSSSKPLASLEEMGGPVSSF